MSANCFRKAKLKLLNGLVKQDLSPTETVWKGLKGVQKEPETLFLTFIDPGSACWAPGHPDPHSERSSHLLLEVDKLSTEYYRFGALLKDKWHIQSVGPGTDLMALRPEVPLFDNFMDRPEKRLIKMSHVQTWWRILQKLKSDTKVSFNVCAHFILNSLNSFSPELCWL